MKRIFVILFFIFGFQVFSQEDAWVYFADKPNSQFYFDNPLEMLSQRSLDRRTSQNIAIDIKDVPIHQPYVDQVMASEGIEVMAKSKWFNAVHVRGQVADIQNLSSLAFVDHVFFANRSLNAAGKTKGNSKKSTIAKSGKVNKVNKTLDTNAAFPYGNSANQVQMLNAHLLHQQDYTGTGKIIAVMDAGFPNVDAVSPFQRLRDNSQILGGYNFPDRTADIYTRSAHGTMVLSTMGGYVENQLIGTAPDAQYYLFITEDNTSENPVEESYWVEAAEVADSLGVDVINTSLGYFFYDNPTYNYNYADLDGTSSFISQGADIAFSRGMICVTSAGNSGATGNPFIGVPSDAINTLGVGAVKADEAYGTFSSIGPSSDGRVKPDVMAQGQAAVIANVSGNVVTGSGTSFAGPIMAGAVASFWQAVPSLTNIQVINFIRQSADRFDNPTPQFGYGIPDFQLALDLARLSIKGNDVPSFLVYPNPVSDNLQISFPSGLNEARIILFDILGQSIFEQTISDSKASISLASLNSGIYFYRIQANSLTQSGKIIKN